MNTKHFPTEAVIRPFTWKADTTLRTLLTLKSLLMTHGLESNQISLIFQDGQADGLPWSHGII